MVRFDRIDSDRPHFFKIIPVDGPGNFAESEKKVVFLRLLQSQVQSGTASARLEQNPHDIRPAVFLQKILDPGICLLRNFKHAASSNRLLYTNDRISNSLYKRLCNEIHTDTGDRHPRKTAEPHPGAMPDTAFHQLSHKGRGTPGNHDRQAVTQGE